ncbi:MAG: peptidase M14, partial [Flavobacteriaceae bacterium]|nr:peptidase M14 [Flavobacteriaceae bacterium]
NFFNSEGFEDEKRVILENTTLHFMPMVNPDGAENFTRRNVLSIDLNRDALRLQTPEAQTLKKVRDSLEADFGFNLHDQSTYYNAEGTPKPATISFLAPAYNFEKEINPVRKRAMQIIVSMNQNLQQLVPGQVGRYSDDFEPRAFGDNFQKWGTSTILIESGGYKDDAEKQEIRKLNFVSILSALLTIANDSYNGIDISEYEKIPNNDRKLFDLKIKGATYQFGNNEYIIDLGINHNEIGIDNQTDYYNVGGIMDIGDLSTSFGYETLDAEGYKIVSGKLYDQAFADISKIDEAKAFDLLSKGFTHIRVNQIPKEQEYVNLPIQILGPNAKQPKFDLNFGRNPTFLLSKDGKFDYAVVNGFLVDLNSRESRVRNGLIIRK